MTIKIKQRLLPDGQPNKPSCSMQPQCITIHNTDNPAPGATAESHARYILNGSSGREVSWHYTVDDNEIYQHLRDNEQGWHAGDDNGPGNTSSIGIEVCMYEGINEPKAWQRAAELAAVLLCRHGLAIGKVVPHKHWSGKACPSRILPRWPEFIKMIEKELGKQQPKSSAKVTNILGKASATLAQAKAWARSHKAPAEFIDLADLYWELAPERGGVDPAVAYVQFGHETGYLYRDGHSAAGIDSTYCNPCGLKIKAGGGDTQASAHKRFCDWFMGVAAHLDHLALYAGAAGYPKKETPDPRHFAHLHGTAKTVEALGTKWAPSPEYGKRLVGELAKLRCMRVSKQPDKPANSVTIAVNGCALDKPGLIIDGVTYAPVRAMAEAVGAKVSGWDGKGRKVEISSMQNNLSELLIAGSVPNVIVRNKKTGHKVVLVAVNPDSPDLLLLGPTTIRDEKDWLEECWTVERKDFEKHYELL